MSFKTMLQFALMLLSANALTCNVWATSNGVKSPVTEMACMDVGGMTMDKCVTYSYTSDMAGTTVAVNAGTCGMANYCAATKTAAEATGSISDWKCATCDGDLCNTENSADEGSDTPGEPNEPASTLKCNVWATTNGVTTDGSEQECTTVYGLDKCVSYSYTFDRAGSTMAPSVGGCGSASFCTDAKTAIENSMGAVSDWKCATCDGDLCNTMNSADEGSDTTGGPNEPEDWGNTGEPHETTGASALTCNYWNMHNGVIIDGPDQECVAAAGQDKCISYSYSRDRGMAGITMAVNSGGCGSATYCASSKRAAEAYGAVPDWKCTACDGDLCNTKTNPAGPGGGDDSAEERGKSFHMEADGICMSVTTENNCTLASINSEWDGITFKVGGCPATYTTECSFKLTYADGETSEMPMTTDTDCGKLTLATHTKDCAACTGHELDEGDSFESGPTCSNADPCAGKTEGASCDDGNDNTTDDKCDASGKCVGVEATGPKMCIINYRYTDAACTKMASSIPNEFKGLRHGECISNGPEYVKGTCNADNIPDKVWMGCKTDQCSDEDSTSFCEPEGYDFSMFNKCQQEEFGDDKFYTKWICEECSTVSCEDEATLYDGTLANPECGDSVTPDNVEDKEVVKFEMTLKIAKADYETHKKQIKKDIATTLEVHVDKVTVTVVSRRNRRLLTESIKLEVAVKAADDSAVSAIKEKVEDDTFAADLAKEINDSTNLNVEITDVSKPTSEKITTTPTKTDDDSNNTTMIIIIVVAIVAVLLIAAFVWYTMNNNEKTSNEGEAVEFQKRTPVGV